MAAVKEKVKGYIINGPDKWELLTNGLPENNVLDFEVNFPLTQVMKVQIFGIISLSKVRGNHDWLVMGQLIEKQPNNDNDHDFKFPTYFYAKYSTKNRKGEIEIKEFDINDNSPFDPAELLKNF